MKLLGLIVELRERPQRFLEVVSPIYLDALLHGYSAVDLRASRMKRAVDLLEGSASSLSVCSRMYLAEQDPAKGVEVLLEKFEAVLRAPADEGPVRGVFAGRQFASVVAEVVNQGRPGLAFGEPTLSWVYHFSVGFDLAFGEEDLEAADADRRQLMRFSEWLSRRYGSKAVVPWHRLLRVHEGEALRGLKAFVGLWDQFVATTSQGK
jgi:hypothetical protein